MNAAHDMAMVKVVPDMTTPLLNCLGVGGCVLNCLGSGTSATLDGCITQCQPMAKKTSFTYWIDAFICGQDYCTGANDASATKCVTTGNTLADPPGSPTNTCSNCLANARNFILGDFTDPNLPTAPTGMCPMPTSPDCKGGMECMAKFNSCLNDL